MSRSMDPRYGCALCATLPHPGYLDRLRKGRDKSKEKYSLQHHVETHHPDILDWQSLQTNLPKFVRPGNRKRKKAALLAANNVSSSDNGNSKSKKRPRIVISSSDSDSDGDADDNDDAPPPRRSGRTLRGARQQPVNHDDDDSDPIVVRPGLGGQRDARDDEDAGEIRRRPMPRPPSEEILVRLNAITAAQAARQAQRQAQAPAQAASAAVTAATAAPNIPNVPFPVTIAVQPGPPENDFTRSRIFDSVMAAAPYRGGHNIEDLRAENIELNSSVQTYERVNNSLRADVRSLSYIVTNVLEAGLLGQEPTMANVHSWLSVYAREDTGVAERFAGRITNELSRRFERDNSPPRPTPPQRHAEPLTHFQRMDMSVSPPTTAARQTQVQAQSDAQGLLQPGRPAPATQWLGVNPYPSRQTPGRPSVSPLSNLWDRMNED